MTEHNEPHALCLLAANHLQEYLSTQKDWKHNFGLEANDKGAIIGKMFGVLVVSTADGKIGYLAAFSGKLAGVNHHTWFVPPVFDLLTENSFLNTGMQQLTLINQEIKSLELICTEESEAQIVILKARRRKHSHELQHEIYNHYQFLNQAGEEKNLRDIFKDAGYKNPPSGAGECAGPKLLQYAFSNKLKPLALAEFWWGRSPKSEFWKHGEFYPCCKEKCSPILAHMLSDIDYVQN